MLVINTEDFIIKKKDSIKSLVAVVSETIEIIFSSISMGFSEIMVEHFQDYLDGNLETCEIAEHEQVYIDGDAMKVLQELLESQSGDAAKIA